MPGARACGATSRSTPTATRCPTTCGARSRRPRASRSPHIAHDFTLQPGVPLIRVGDGDLQRRRDHGDARRRASSRKDRPDKQPLAWRVPVIAAASAAGEPVRTLVEGGTATVDVPGCDPVVVNAGQSGYYRTLYAPRAVRAHRGRFRRAARRSTSSACWATAGRSAARACSRPRTSSTWRGATPADADPQIWGEIAADLRRARRLLRAATGTRGDAFRTLRARAPGAGLRARRLDRAAGRAGAGRDPAHAADRHAGRARRSGGDRRGAPPLTPRRRRTRRRCPAPLRKTILGVVARHADAATWDQLHAAALAEKTPLVKDQLYFAARRPPRTRPWPGARSTWR